MFDKKKTPWKGPLATEDFTLCTDKMWNTMSAPLTNRKLPRDNMLLSLLSHYSKNY